MNVDELSANLELPEELVEVEPEVEEPQEVLDEEPEHKKTLAERLAEMKAEEQSNVSRETEEPGLNDDEFEF